MRKKIIPLEKCEVKPIFPLEKCKLTLYKGKYMYRKIYEELVAWKQNKYRKPLVLNGTRQVGKTWILKEFGNKEYESIAYINCDNNPLLKDIFYDFDMERLIRSFSAITNVRIEKEKTLIILDWLL